MRDGGGGVSERISTRLAEHAAGLRVADVRIGLGYTAVRLEDGWIGVSLTLRDAASRGCSVFRGTRPLAGRRARVLLDLLESDEPLERSVGLACANSVANRPSPDHRHGDILEHIEIRAEDRVGMVGYFGPLVAAIRERARSLTIFERDTDRAPDVRPADEAMDALPRCDVALITASAILNSSMEVLLDAARDCREVAVIGASTPLVPEVFRGTSVTLLSGVVADDPEVLQVVSEGGGMREFKKLVRKVSLPLLR